MLLDRLSVSVPNAAERSAASRARRTPAKLAAPSTEWMLQAACRGMDPELFFPERGESVAQARAVCAGCPVREACLEYAVVVGERYGMWGAKSERERRGLRRYAKRSVR